VRFALLAAVVACGGSREEPQHPFQPSPPDARPSDAPLSGVKDGQGGSAAEPVAHGPPIRSESDPAPDDPRKTSEPIPAGSIVKPPDVLVVLPFDGEPLRGGEVTNQFRIETGTSNANDRIVLTTALVAHNQCAPAFDDACLASVGRQSKFDWVVFGTVKPKNDRKTISVRLISASDPKVSRAVTFDVVDDLAAAVHRAWIRVSAR
jgi:hypothetical protein